MTNPIFRQQCLERAEAFALDLSEADVALLSDKAESIKTMFDQLRLTPENACWIRTGWINLAALDIERELKGGKRDATFVLIGLVLAELDEVRRRFEILERSALELTTADELSDLLRMR